MNRGGDWSGRSSAQSSANTLGSRATSESDAPTLLSLQDSVCNPLVRAASLVDVVRRSAADGVEGPCTAALADTMAQVSFELSSAIEVLHSAFSRTAILQRDYEPQALTVTIGELVDSVHAPASGVSVGRARGTSREDTLELDPTPLRMAISELRHIADALADRPMLALSVQLEDDLLSITAHALPCALSAVEGAAPACESALEQRLLVDACAHALGGHVRWDACDCAPVAAPITEGTAGSRDVAAPLPPFAELLLPVKREAHIGATIDSFRLPAEATVIIVDDSRLTRTIIRARVVAHLCQPGMVPVVIPPCDMRDDDPEAARMLGEYAETLGAYVRAGPVVLFSDHDLGVGVPTGAQVIQHVRATVPEAEANLVACVVSANGSTPDRRAYAEMGADAFVGKTRDGVRHARQTIARACERRFATRLDARPSPPGARAASSEVLEELGRAAGRPRPPRPPLGASTVPTRTRFPQNPIRQRSATGAVVAGPAAAAVASMAAASPASARRLSTRTTFGRPVRPPARPDDEEEAGSGSSSRASPSASARPCDGAAPAERPLMRCAVCGRDRLGAGASSRSCGRGATLPGPHPSCLPEAEAEGESRDESPSERPQFTMPSLRRAHLSADEAQGMLDEEAGAGGGRRRLATD